MWEKTNKNGLLLHLIATHRPAHLQHEYTTILIQVGDVLPVKSFRAMWETAMIMLGKYKQGEVWMEGAGNVPCPEVCRQDKYTLKDGYMIPVNNQFLALNPTTKYSIVPAKGERIVVTSISDMKELRLCADDTMETRLIVPSRAPEVWEQHERDGHMPKFPDCPVCVQEHGSLVKHCFQYHQ